MLAASPQLGSLPAATYVPFPSCTVADRGVPVPFVSAIVETADATTVRANLVDVEPEPDSVRLGMAVRFVTYPIGTDSEGTECIAFGFTPAEE